ncbi:unnamed protein product, partial [Cyprideis torosa]
EELLWDLMCGLERQNKLVLGSNSNNTLIVDGTPVEMPSTFQEASSNGTKGWRQRINPDDATITFETLPEEEESVVLPENVITNSLIHKLTTAGVLPSDQSANKKAVADLQLEYRNFINYVKESILKSRAEKSKTASHTKRRLKAGMETSQKSGSLRMRCASTAATGGRRGLGATGGRRGLGATGGRRGLGWGYRLAAGGANVTTAKIGNLFATEKKSSAGKRGSRQGDERNWDTSNDEEAAKTRPKGDWSDNGKKVIFSVRRGIVVKKREKAAKKSLMSTPLIVAALEDLNLCTKPPAVVDKYGAPKKSVTAPHLRARRPRSDAPGRGRPTAALREGGLEPPDESEEGTGAPPVLPGDATNVEDVSGALKPRGTRRLRHSQSDRGGQLSNLNRKSMMV